MEPSADDRLSRPAPPVHEAASSDHIRGALRAAGLRATPQRRAVLGQLHAAGTHLTADEVFHDLDGGGVGLDRSTVYRCLTQLRDAGLVGVIHTGDGSARYEPAAAGHLHVVCQLCGAARHASSSSFLQAGREVAVLAGLPLGENSMTLLGTCLSCAPRSQQGAGETPSAG